jgi:fatty acid desaturase
MLRNKSDLRTVLTVALYFASVVFSWFAYQSVWYIAMPLVILICGLSFFCAVIVHNSIHVPVFKQRWANRSFQVLLTWSHGHPVSGFVPGHNLGHHQHLLTEKDAAHPERMRFKSNFLNQLLFFFAISSTIMKDERNFVKGMRDRNPRWVRQYYFEFISVVAIKIALTIIDWQKAIFLLWLPHFYATWGILGTNYWQHDGCQADHPYNHSRNFTGRIFNFLTFNNGFHAAHHLNPGVHWSDLPAYHRNHVEPHNHPNLNQVNFLSYLIRTYVYPGRRQDFQGRPVRIDKPVKNSDWVSEVDWEDDRLNRHLGGAV